MGKKDDLAGDLLRGRKIKKKIVPTAEEATEIVKKITTPKSKPKKTQNTKPPKSETEVSQRKNQNQIPIETSKKVEKKLIRTTIDLPAYVHKAIKVKAAQEGISLKKYLVSLVKNDLDLE